MAVGGEGGAVQDEVGGVLRCREVQVAGGVAGAVPFILHRNLEASASSGCTSLIGLTTITLENNCV